MLFAIIYLKGVENRNSMPHRTRPTHKHINALSIKPITSVEIHGVIPTDGFFPEFRTAMLVRFLRDVSDFGWYDRMMHVKRVRSTPPRYLDL